MLEGKFGMQFIVDGLLNSLAMTPPSQTTPGTILFFEDVDFPTPHQHK
jgi:hypothetical protein